MNERIQQLEAWIKVKENEHFEFKEAKQHLDLEKLTKYCVALANEGGGKFILGITDKRPRKVVGTSAFLNIEKTKTDLAQRIHLRIDAEEIAHPKGRVLVFHVPSRPIGMPIQYKGSYYMRSGDSLVPMLPDTLKRIFDEAEPDYSAEINTRATLNDLDTAMIENFRKRWMEKSNNTSLKRPSAKQLLADAELFMPEGLSNAALILFGKEKSLGRLFAQAEVIYEYRSSDVTGPAQERHEFRRGFFSFYDELWDLISKRNDIQHYQDGLIMRDIPTLNEAAVREALLNAVSHRDYRLAGSVIIRQYPRRLEVVSPGGLPPGISLENILWEQSPRNRRIAEAFARCGLVERSGQGMNRIYETCIKEGKPKPDFARTGDSHFWLTLHGMVQNPELIRFLEKVGQERITSFSTQDLLLIDHIYREERIPENLKDTLPGLTESGVIERIGKGRGSSYILSQQFYDFTKKKGSYTRKKGLDKGTNKALLLKHIEDNKKDGSRMVEFRQVLPNLSTDQIKVLLKDLQTEEKIHTRGRTRGARWFPGPPSVD